MKSVGQKNTAQDINLIHC